MGTVGSPEEIVKINTSATATHIIPYYYSYTPFLAQVSNLAAKISLVSENYGIGANKYSATEMVQSYKVVRYPYSSAGGIRDRLTLKYLNRCCFSHMLIIIIFDMY